MFVAVVRFPKVPAERDADFRQWFAWSNSQLRGAAGLTSRRLLIGSDQSYLALVEHESSTSFARMHASLVAKEVQSHLHKVLDGVPEAEMYEVVEDVAEVVDEPAGGCCGGHQGTPAPTDHVATAAPADCCRPS